MVLLETEENSSQKRAECKVMDVPAWGELADKEGSSLTASHR